MSGLQRQVQLIRPLQTTLQPALTSAHPYTAIYAISNLVNVMFIAGKNCNYWCVLFSWNYSMLFLLQRWFVKRNNQVKRLTLESCGQRPSCLLLFRLTGIA